MRTLHVAALPFPSPQGTQALLHAMLTALAEAGHDTHLLCYPHGAFIRAAPYHVHRGAGRVVDKSLRSGPSLRKFAQDAQLVRDLHALVRSLKPERVLAHHVEAALAAYAAGLRNVTYVAHTNVAEELSSYFPARMGRACGWLGAGLDLAAALPAGQRLAISPLLVRDLSRQSGRAFTLLVPPWHVPEPITESERQAARALFGFGAIDEILLYAGNLDAYQGLDVLCAGLTLAFAQRPQARFLLATASDDARGFLARLPSLLSTRSQLVTLDGDAIRRQVHAAADVALVPRKSPGGLPVKLLDALSRGLPVLCAERATAGFQFGAACRTVSDDDARSWAQSIGSFFDLSPEHRRGFSGVARAQIARAHHPDAFVRELLLSRA